MKILFAIFLGVIIDILCMILRGFVLSKLWLYFIVPFFGAKELPIPYAIGLAILIGLATYKGTKDDVDEDQDVIVRFITAGLTARLTPAFTSLIAWGLGTIVSRFV